MKTRCSFCGADINESIEHNIECIENCTNCLADLKLKGKWTGTAQKIMSHLVEKYGAQELKLTVEKIKFSQM